MVADFDHEVFAVNVDRVREKSEGALEHDGFAFGGGALDLPRSLVCEDIGQVRV